MLTTRIKPHDSQSLIPKSLCPVFFFAPRTVSGSPPPVREDCTAIQRSGPDSKPLQASQAKPPYQRRSVPPTHPPRYSPSTLPSDVASTRTKLFQCVVFLSCCLFCMLMIRFQSILLIFARKPSSTLYFENNTCINSLNDC